VQCLNNLAKRQGEVISTEPRINDRIRVPEVRLIGYDGEQLGVTAIDKALKLSEEIGLDLVEISPDANPPVCKIMDFGKYKYEIAQKAREARQNQTHIVVKEMRLRPNIEPHDYETKRNHIERFLLGGDKVKVTIQFRGREQSRPEMGYRLLQKLAEELAEVSLVEFARVTGSGKIMHERAGKRHLLERKSSRLTRRLTGDVTAKAPNAFAAKRMLGLK